MNWWTDSGVDKASLIASFTGALAYLCTQDRMPLVRAGAYLLAGTAAAAYIAPAASEIAQSHGVILGEHARAALTFVMGVGGIWILNFIVRATRTASDRAGDLTDAAINRVTGKGGSK